jgi:site-specific DNA-methyltransferase (adenine-specific)
MDTTEQEPAAVWVDTVKLKAWQENPRDNDKAVPAVVESIKRFGFASPIIARPNGEIIAGHTRLKAALELRMPQVPVRYMDLDPGEAHLLALADNRVGELADWDDGILQDVLKDMEAEGLDLSGIGWDVDELADLLGQNDPLPGDGDAEDERDLDAIPEDVPAITKPGEVVTLGRHTLHCGDCLEVMRSMPDASVDAIVTDPPYGIGFMGKGWDCSVPGDAFAAEALRVLKPGGHLIAFAATRTVHRLTVALEDSGLEIRDQLAWIQWQGFPKSHDVSKALDQHHGAEREVVGSYQGATNIGRKSDGKRGYAPGTDYPEVDRTAHQTAPATEDAKTWEGWGTALKPAYEPCVLARKPLEGTVAENVLAHGVGGINIDGCRYAYGDPAWPGPGDAVDLPDRNVGPSGVGSGVGAGITGLRDGFRPASSALGRWPANLYACPKASRGEREAGCEGPVKGVWDETRDPDAPGGNNPRNRGTTERGNHHPTVKPVGLMRWLVRLVTPPGATVLEPFLGSGTTLLAAEAEGVTCIGIEREPGYCDIVRARFNGLED